jgi:hypothetical protein
LYAERILALVAEQADRTLDELVAALHKLPQYLPVLELPNQPVKS